MFPNQLELFKLANPKLFTLPCLAFPMEAPVKTDLHFLPISFCLLPDTDASTLTLCDILCLLFLGELGITLNFSFNSIDHFLSHSHLYNDSQIVFISMV